MVDVRPVTPSRLKRAATPMVLVAVLGALGLTAGCGSYDRNIGQETRKGELEALEKMPKFIQDDFRAGDKNSDGRIQDTELETMIEEDFRTGDVNGDGVMSGKDVGPGGGNAKSYLGSRDLNGDGKVPMKEFAEHVERSFMHKADTNNDGHLDPPEVATYYGAAFVSSQDAK